VIDENSFPPVNGGGLLIQNTLTVDAGHQVTLNGTASMTFDGQSQTIDNLDIEGAATTRMNPNVSFSGPDSNGPVTVTLGPNVLIHGLLTLSNGSQSTTLVNDGIINADQIGLYSTVLVVRVDNFANDGTAEATNSGTLLVWSNWNNATGGMITANGGVVVFTSNGSNAGMIQATNGGTVEIGVGDEFVGGIFQNNGLLEANNGSVIQLGTNLTWSNSGKIVLKNGTVSAASVNVGDGTLSGSGTIDGDLTLSSDPSTLTFDTGGETQGNLYDSLEVDGNVTLAGNLEISLINGFEPSQSDVFTVLTVDSADTLSGEFLNIADGGRLEAMDGGGSFVVNYESGAYANKIVLGDFEASNVPEPATAGIVGIGLGLLVRRGRNSSLFR